MWQYFAKSNSSMVTFDVNQIQPKLVGFLENLVEFLSNKSDSGRFIFGTLPRGRPRGWAARTDIPNPLVWTARPFG